MSLCAPSGYFHKDFLKGKRYLCKKIKRKKVHVNKAPPPTPAQNNFQQSMQPQLPFLDPLGGLGSHASLTASQQLLQQQQLALGLPGAGGSSLGGSSLFNNNSLLNASSDLSQAYIQDLPGLQSPATGSRLHAANFNAMNLNNFNANNGNLRG